MSIPINFFTWICALLPILAILVLMVGFKWSASKAGPIGWFIALIVGITVFKANFWLLSYSSAKGMVMAFYVLYIIWGALLLYHVVNEVGGIETIGATFIEMTKNRILLLLMFGVAFVTFLQGVAGFGVPVAVGAPLLVSLGFPLTTAVAVPLIGHSWSVTFGDMASSFSSLQQATGLPGPDLAPFAAFFTGLAGVVCAFFAIHCYAGWKGVRKGWLPALVVGGVMALVQFGVAQWEPALATFIAGIVGIVVTAFMTRFYREEDEDLAAVIEAAASAEPGTATKVITIKKKMNFHLAFAAYYALIVIVALQEFVPGLEDWMKSVLVVAFKCPQYATAYGWVTKAGWSSKVGTLGHVGALLVYAAIIGIIIYSVAGYWKGEMWGKVLTKVAKDGLGSSIATSSMVLMAFIMVETGMTYTLAKGVATAFGVVYPVLAPLVGVLGAFMTGSNTNSNVMFGAFQAQIAKILGVSTLIMASAQTAGGSIGSMLAPAKVIVGTSTVGLTGREGEVIGKTLKYCLLLGVVIGILAWIMLFVIFRHVY